MNFKEILNKHADWRLNEEGGEIADLRGADLHEADLHEADLRGADLRGADLHEANLRGAKGIYAFGPMPTSGRICTAVWHESGWMVSAGCFCGTLEELERAVIEKHKCPVYLANIALLRAFKYETK